MEILYNDNELEKYLKRNSKFILDGPILVDKFLNNAIEIDVDALSDGKEVYVAGIMQHIEEAGIHSGDSACSIPPYSLSKEIIEEIKQSTIKLAKILEVVGLMNVQYAVKEGKIYVIEVNPRASRTVPFVAKATGISIAKIASLLMVGRKLAEFKLEEFKRYDENYYSVKEVVLPFARFANVDTLLGPEMKSTGEVMGIDKDFDMAFAKSQIAAGNKMVSSGAVLISVKDGDKADLLIEIAKKFQQSEFKIFATVGTAKFLEGNGFLNIVTVKKEDEEGYNVLTLVEKKVIDLVINTALGTESVARSFNLRRNALMSRLFYVTTISAAHCLVNSIVKIREKKDFEIVCLQEM
jgi:carbamoyl-phosphate synthase large subunit